MQNNALQKGDLHKRLVKFTVAIIRLAHKHEKDRVLSPIFNQIIRSAGSIGANISEASGASSRLGYARYFHIALQSGNETAYWLDVLEETGINESEILNELSGELTEFIKILTASLKTMKQPAQRAS